MGIYGVYQKMWVLELDIRASPPRETYTCETCKPQS